MPPDVRADLVRDGVAPQRLGPGGALVVTRGGPGPGRPVARFGDGPEALAVSRTEPRHRARGGGQRRLGAAAPRQPGRARRRPARAVLRDGQADPRALLVLAVLAARDPVHVLDLPGVSGEDPTLPRHQVVLTGLDAEALAWVRAQRPPFTPLVTDRG